MAYLAEVKFYGPTNTKGSRWRVRIPGDRIGDGPVTRWRERRPGFDVYYDVWRAVLAACQGTRWEPASHAVSDVVFVGPDETTYYVVLRAREA